MVNAQFNFIQYNILAHRGLVRGSLGGALSGYSKDQGSLLLFLRPLEWRMRQQADAVLLK